MPRPTILLKRSLIFIHRWVGVALSVIFGLWFVSGIVMMYWGFPGVSGRDRAERLPVLKPAEIKLSPEEAYATLGREQGPASVSLSSFDGRPVYRFGGSGGGGGRGGNRGGGGRGGGGGGQTMVYADDGSTQTEVDDAMFDRVASAWAGLPLSDAKKESVEEVDQWTVGGQLRTLRPLYKYTFKDGQEVYVSGRDANVVQYTTTASRFWAYLGAIPHWLYFTPLRVHQPEWFAFVVWSSAIGTGAALLGIVIAIWMLSPKKKKYRYEGQPTAIPYKGQKRWHTILGLVFGVTTATWAFSGLLSMGPFEWTNWLSTLGSGADTAKGKGKGKGGAPNVNIANILRGEGRFDLASYSAKDVRQAIASIADFQPKEIDFTMFAGEPLYMASNAQGDTRIIPLNSEPKASFDANEILNMVRAGAGDSLAELRMMDEYDAYYQDRTRQRTLPVVYARMNDAANTRYYIDPTVGRVAGTYSSRNWVNRWLYHGLHSLDFPWLYKYRPLWDIVVITLMLGGTALCVTSLVLTWRVLKKKVARILPVRVKESEDLVAEPERT